jgi:hypothetical protein
VIADHRHKTLEIISRQLSEVESIRDYLTASAVGARIALELSSKMETHLISIQHELGLQ